MKSIIEKITDVLKQYPEIVFAIVFGSFTKGDVRARDIDIAIYMDAYKGLAEEIGLRMKIENALGKVLPLRPDVRVINNAPVEVSLNIIETGMVVYVKDRSRYTDYLERLSREALDTIQNRISLKEAEDEILCL